MVVRLLCGVGSGEGCVYMCGKKKKLSTFVVIARFFKIEYFLLHRGPKDPKEKLQFNLMREGNPCLVSN